MSRAVIAEANPARCEELRGRLGDAGLEVVAVATSAVEAVGQVLELAPDVAILAAGLAAANRFSALDVIRSASPGTAVVLMGAAEEPGHLLDALAHGASCCLGHDASLESLALAATAAAQGYSLADRATLQRAVSEAAPGLA